MKIMVIVKANKASENGFMPSERLLKEMNDFNQVLIDNKIMLAGEGLAPGAQAKQVVLSSNQAPRVVSGPFGSVEERIAGFWIWNVKSLDEALEWVKRCPDPMPDEEAEIEIRPVFEADDFGEEFTPELRAQEERLRAEIERQQRSGS